MQDAFPPPPPPPHTYGQLVCLMALATAPLAGMTRVVGYRRHGYHVPIFCMGMSLGGSRLFLVRDHEPCMGISMFSYSHDHTC